jgi:uncharacterized protein YoxC
MSTKNPTDVERFHQALEGAVLLVAADGTVRANAAWSRRFGVTPAAVGVPGEGAFALDLGSRSVDVVARPFKGGWIVEAHDVRHQDALLAAATALAEGRTYISLSPELRNQPMGAALSRIDAAWQCCQRLCEGSDESAGDHAILGMLARTLQQLRSQSRGILDTSAQLQSGSARVREASQALADNAARSAASLEQISASMEEISSQTQDNASSAARALTIANKARDAANVGDAQMVQVRDAMSAIDSSGRNISNIIRVIDDIAFQTNLLALNAAVEAGRAGVHGRGFAVVADEVRRLAGRSADAARETADLIMTSLQHLEEGQRVVVVTADSLSTIVEEVTEVSHLIESMAKSTQEQAMAASEVNEALAMVDSLTQHNAAKAAEMATTAFDLAQDSQGLTGHIAADTSTLRDPPRPQHRPGDRAALNDVEFGPFS